MKISEMIKELEKIKKESGDEVVVISSDEEGNNFGYIEKDSFAPSFVKNTMAIFPMGTMEIDDLGGEND
jgi:predicted RNA-binding protein with PUA domain